MPDSEHDNKSSSAATAGTAATDSAATDRPGLPHHVSLRIKTPEPVPAEADGGDARPEQQREREVVAPTETPRDADQPSGGSTTLRNSKGWDGKLRLPSGTLGDSPAASPTGNHATVVMANPEALSDPDYSDDENVLPGDKIDADEGS